MLVEAREGNPRPDRLVGRLAARRNSEDLLEVPTPQLGPHDLDGIRGRAAATETDDAAALDVFYCHLGSSPLRRIDPAHGRAPRFPSRASRVPRALSRPLSSAARASPRPPTCPSWAP